MAPARARWSRPVLAELGELLLLGWFCAWLVVQVEPRLVYQAQQPPFSLNREFLGGLLAHVGGLARGLALLLAQLDANSLAGTLVRVAQAVLIGRLSDSLLTRLAGRRVPWARLAPMALFMLLCGRYDQPLPLAPMVIGLLATALWFAAGPPTFRRFLALAGWYLLAVAGAWGLATLYQTVGALAGTCGVLAVWRDGRRRASPLLVVGYVGAALAAVWALQRLGLSAFDATWPFRGEESRLTRRLGVALVVWTPAAALLAGCLAAPVTTWLARRSVAGPRGARRVLGPLLATALVSLLAARVTVDVAGRERARMDDAVLTRRWDRALTAAAKATRPYELSAFAVNRALCAKGVLGELMFQVPQRPDGLLLSVETPYVLVGRVLLADQYLDLGRLNLAEFALQNTYVQGPDNPYVLSRLVRLYKAKGQTEAARLYLHLLADNLVWRRWAREQLRLLDRDPVLADADTQQLRSVMLLEDDLLRINRYADNPKERAWHIVPEILGSLLRRNPRNRMALEYLVAAYLVTGQPQAAAAQMHRLRDLGVTTLPRGWAEAALVARDLPGPEPDLAGLTIPEEARAGYRRFRRLLAQYRHDPRQALALLQQECAGTYFLYLARLETSR